ncbi:MAG: hypothetical protein ACFCBW_08465 [Candidatus Competibacterales bacterium]
MKKLCLVSLAVAGALGTSSQAAVLSEFANGVLIPRTFANADNSVITAIGLTSCAAGVVHGYLFNAGSLEQVNFDFPVTRFDQTSITVTAGSINIDDRGDGPVIVNNVGLETYMVFILNTVDGEFTEQLSTGDQPCLAGNSFLIDSTAGGDVAVVPTLPLYIANPEPGEINNDGVPAGNGSGGDIGGRSGGDFGAPIVFRSEGLVYIEDLDFTGPRYVVNLAAGANHGDLLYMRYFIDGADANSRTDIYIWTAQDISQTAPTVFLYDTNQQQISTRLTLGEPQLNNLAVTNNNGRASFTTGTATLAIGESDTTDGFVLWSLGGPGEQYIFGREGDEPEYRDGTNNGVSFGDGIFTWSQIQAIAAFGATQTIINPIELRESPNNDGDLIIRERVQRVRQVLQPQPIFLSPDTDD